MEQETLDRLINIIESHYKDMKDMNNKLMQICAELFNIHHNDKMVEFMQPPQPEQDVDPDEFNDLSGGIN
jgi:hypothetical protein